MKENNPIIYTDSHSHIYESTFDGESPNVVERSIAAGVSRIFLAAVDSSNHAALISLANKYPSNCFPMIGVHPTTVNDNPNYRDELSIVEDYLKNPPVSRFYAIGEVGLDLHWSKSFLAEQLEVFRAQIELSIKYDLPLVIHTRDAWGEMVKVLADYKSRGLRGVIHSYSGSLEVYKIIKSYGDFVFGMSGVVTYKNSGISKDVVDMSIDDLVLETDSPYLPPTPFRGKRNESSYIPYICSKISELKSLSVEDVARITTANTVRIFGV